MNSENSEKKNNVDEIKLPAHENKNLLWVWISFEHKQDFENFCILYPLLAPHLIFTTKQGYAQILKESFTRIWHSIAWCDKVVTNRRKHPKLILREPWWFSGNTQNCHDIGFGFNSHLCQKKGYPWACSAVHCNSVIKGQVLYMVNFCHGQDKEPLRPFEKSRE